MRLSKVIVVLLLLVGGAALPMVLIRPDLPCDSDESHHVGLGLTYERDLAHGEFVAFARHTLKTARYPFLHGWYVGGAFGLFGGSYFVARATSAVLLGLAAALAAMLIFRLLPRAHPLWGVLAGAIVVLAPLNLVNGTLCMLEVPGLALMLLGAYSYRRFIEEPDRTGFALLAGLTVVALFLVKYPYGAYLLVPLLAAEAVRTRLAPRALFGKKSLAVWLPMGLTGVLWLVLPWTRQSLFTLLGDAPHATVSDATPDPLRIPYVQPELVWFYGKVLLERLSPGLVLGALLFFGSLVTLLRGRLVSRVVVVGAILWTVFTLTLSYRTFGVGRFLVPVSGLFAVAGVAGLARLVQGGLAGREHGRAGAFLLLLVVVVGATEAAWRTIAFADRWAADAVETSPEELAAAGWILESVKTPANLLVVGAWDQLSEGTLEVEYLFGNPDARPEDLDVKAIRTGKLYRGTDRVERWFAEERHWRPEGETGRREYVLFVDHGARADRRFADPENHGIVRARAEELLPDGAREVATTDVAEARFRLYLLP